MLNWRTRLAAAGVHLALSATIAALAAALVFFVWYPAEYRELAGGRDLFVLMVSVDVVLGPLITLSVFDIRKPRKVLRRDLAVIGVIQLAALAYGLWTVFYARPVHLVFEIDRFRVIHAVDVPAELLPKAPPELQMLPLTGPTVISTRAFRDPNEKMELTLAALQGLHLGARPELWQSYDAGRPEVLRQSRPLSQLLQRFPARNAEIQARVRALGRTVDGVAYVPLAGRRDFWTALVDPISADVLGFIDVDSF